MLILGLNMALPNCLCWRMHFVASRRQKSAGMRCVGVAANGRVENLRQAGADHVISNFLDFSLEQLLQPWITIAESLTVFRLAATQN